MSTMCIVVGSALASVAFILLVVIILMGADFLLFQKVSKLLGLDLQFRVLIRVWVYA